MATRAVAGDFLREAARQLQEAAINQEPAIRPADLTGICQSLGQVTVVLGRYLDDVGPFSGVAAHGTAVMSGWPRAALAARESLRKAAHEIGYEGIWPASATATAGNATATALRGAAGSLTLARDLLHSHLAPLERGGPYVSEWAGVILSPQVTRALTAEVGFCLDQLARITVGLAQPFPGESPRLGPTRSRLAAASYSMWAAGECLQQAGFRDPARRADLELLYAIPDRSLPERILPAQADAVPSLCVGTVSTAERVRGAAIWPHPAWSPVISTASLRATSRAAVVISHNSATALETLAARAGELGQDGLAEVLAESGRAALTARARWFSTATVWSGQVAVDVTQSRSPVNVEAGDLAHWTGRLIYTDPEWTPAHGRSTSLRHPAGLTPESSDVPEVIAAVHHASDALQHLAESGHAQVRALASVSRLYVPTRTLPPEYDIPRRYGPCPPGRTASLLDAYLAAQNASTALAGSLDALALATGNPGRVLALARAASGRSPIEPAGPPGRGAPMPGRRHGGLVEDSACGQEPAAGIGM